MKTTLQKTVFQVALALFGISNLSAQWVDQTGNGGAANYRSVHFMNDNIGVAVAESSVFSRTTDGGTTWNFISVAGASHTYGVHFSGSDVGFAVGESGTLFKSTDGGANWSAKTSGTTVRLNAVQLLNTSTAVVVGNGGTILKTTNGGDSWTTIVSGVTNNLIKLQFINATTGFTISETGGIILKTTDGGTTWSNMSSPGVLGFRTAFFIDENTAYLSGASNLFKTTNGGANWSVVNFGGIALMFSIHFTDINNGYIGGQGHLVYETTDAGATWTLATTPSASLNDIFHAFSFPSPNVGYVVGYPSKIKKKGTSTAGNLDLTDSGDKLNMYPNPTSGFMTIQLVDNSKLDQVAVFDLQGKQLLTTESNELDFTKMPLGMYVIKVSTESKTYTERIIVQ
jgi:photosystem II stability/assembly factor-like uncharacterized protein